MTMVIASESPTMGGLEVGDEAFINVSASTITIVPRATNPTVLARSTTNSPAITSPNFTSHPDEPDEQILEALRTAKDRMFVLKLADAMQSLVADRAHRTRSDLPRCESSYHRLLVHRCAGYFRLTPETDSVTKAISVAINPESRIPPRSLADLVPLPSASIGPSFQIMRRNLSAAASSSRSQSSDAIDRDFSDPEPSVSEAGSSISHSTSNSNAKKDRHKTITEREAAYNEARSRIFMGFQEKETGSTSSLGLKGARSGSSNVSVSASASNSSSGGEDPDGDADNASTAPTESERSSHPSSSSSKRTGGTRKNNGHGNNYSRRGHSHPHSHPRTPDSSSDLPSPEEGYGPGVDPVTGLFIPALYDPSLAQPPPPPPQDPNQHQAYPPGSGPAPGPTQMLYPYAYPYPYPYPYPAPPAYYGYYPYPPPPPPPRSDSGDGPETYPPPPPPPPPPQQVAYVPVLWGPPPPSIPQALPQPQVPPPQAAESGEYHHVQNQQPPHPPHEWTQPVMQPHGPPAHHPPPQHVPPIPQNQPQGYINAPHPYFNPPPVPVDGAPSQSAPVHHQQEFYNPGVQSPPPPHINGNQIPQQPFPPLQRPSFPKRGGGAMGPRSNSGSGSQSGRRRTGGTGPRDDVSVTSSSSSSSRQASTTSTSHSPHPLPARPDWAVGLTPSPSSYGTVHGMKKERENNLKDFPPLPGGVNTEEDQRVGSGVWAHNSVRGEDGPGANGYAPPFDPSQAIGPNFIAPPMNIGPHPPLGPHPPPPNNMNLNESGHPMPPPQGFYELPYRLPYQPAEQTPTQLFATPYHGPVRMPPPPPPHDKNNARLEEDRRFERPAGRGKGELYNPKARQPNSSSPVSINTNSSSGGGSGSGGKKEKDGGGESGKKRGQNNAKSPTSTLVDGVKDMKLG